MKGKKKVVRKPKVVNYKIRSKAQLCESCNEEMEFSVFKEFAYCTSDKCENRYVKCKVKT